MGERSMVVEDDSLVVGTRFEQVARSRPAAPAVRYADHELTYAELDARANRVAHALRARGVGPESVVALAVRRDLDMPVALLGIFKAGAAALPVDLDSPRERQRLVLEDAGASLCLAGPRIDTTVWSLPVLRTEDREVLDASPESPAPAAGPDNVLYVVYTSGSTGQPKGIAMTHAPTVRLMDWCAATYQSEPVALQYYPLTSDVGIYEFLTAWWCGGCAVIAAETDRYDLSAIASLVERHAITTILLPFVALDQLARYSAKFPTHLRSLREVTTTGDRLIVTPDLRAMADRLDIRHLDNQWGSTEINVVTAQRLVPPAEAWADLPVIGAPVAGSRVYVLDDSLDHTPINVPGVIHVGGGPLARGYANNPPLTAASFLPDPHTAVPGGRMYCTGDLGRWRPDGTLEFIGREDFQVKLHGYRVEPGEIESYLRARDDIGEAVVVARDLHTPEARLVGYVVALGPAPTEWSLQETVRAALPEYMVPSQFVVLDEMPMTGTGKVDRRSLPEPASSVGAAHEHVPPRDDIEKEIAAVWADVLGVDAISVNDDFFALGGHSLLITQVVHRLRARLNVDLPLRLMFTVPTVAGLAREVGALSTDDTTAPEARP